MMTEDLANRLRAVETLVAVQDVHSKDIEKRLGEIEDTLKWLVRVILGAIVLAAIAYMINGGLKV